MVECRKAWNPVPTGTPERFTAVRQTSPNRLRWIGSPGGIGEVESSGLSGREADKFVVTGKAIEHERFVPLRNRVEQLARATSVSAGPHKSGGSRESQVG